MRIIVAANFSTGSYDAHVINTVKHADAMAKLDHKVSIIAIKGEKGSRSEALNAYYGLHHSIDWICIPQNPMEQLLDVQWYFALLAIPILIQKKPDCIYTRTFILPFISSWFGIPTYSEAHTHLDNPSKAFRIFIRGTHHEAFKKWITISEYLKKGYKKLGAAADKITVLPDAVNLDQFKRPSVLTENNPYSGNGPHVVYAGSLYKYKGISEILGAAKKLHSYKFHLIGGTSQQIDLYKKFKREYSISNVVFHGFKKHHDVPRYLWFADVLLLTHTINHPAAKFTSPVKLAEYFAARKPVVVSDIPALRNWLSDEHVVYAKPDDYQDLARGIQETVENPEDSKIRVQESFKLAEKWSYRSRCKKILGSTDDKFFSKII